MHQIKLNKVTKNINLKQIGKNGISAYQVAVNNGFVGSESDWLESLVGPQGAPGPSSLLYDAVVPDDYSTLSAALTELSDNSSVYIKSGAYTEPGGTFDIQNVQITGSGASELTLGNSLIFTGTNVSISNVSINTNSGKKLALTGEYAALDSCSITGGTIDYFLETGIDSSVAGCHIEATGSNGRVKFGESSRVVGNDIIVPHKYEGGVNLSFYSVFSGNVIHAFAQLNAGGSLVRTVGERVTVAGNTFFCRLGQAFSTDFNCGFNSNSVFQAGGNAVEIYEGAVVDGNNIFLALAGTGIYVDSSVSNGYSALVTGNSVTTQGAAPGVQEPQSGYTGIKVGVNTKKAIISGNSVAGCEFGVDVDGSDETIISSNAFSYYTTAVNNNGSNTIISNNQGAQDNTGAQFVDISTFNDSMANVYSIMDTKASYISGDDSIHVDLENFPEVALSFTGSGGGSSGAWTVVDDVTLLSNAPEVAVSGLNLDNDNVYRILALNLGTDADNAYFAFNAEAPSNTPSQFTTQATRINSNSSAFFDGNTALAITSTKGMFEMTLTKGGTSDKAKGSFVSVRDDSRHSSGFIRRSDTTNITAVRIAVPSGNMLAGSRLVVMKLS